MSLAIGEEGVGGVEAFRVVGPLAGLDAQAVALVGSVELCHLDQALRPWPRHFGDRVAAGRGVRSVDDDARDAAFGTGLLQVAHLGPFTRPVRVNGVAGVLVAPEGKPFSVMAFTVVGGRIVAMDALADPDRLGRLELGA